MLMNRSLLGFAAAILPVWVLTASTAIADVAPPEGFVALFNGQNLDGWKGVIASGKPQTELSEEDLAAAQATADAAMHEHWSVVDGELVFDGNGDSISTANDYGDFELLVDWKIPPAGDSGIYLRSCPQIQIWDTTHEPYFKLGAEKGSGGIWNNKQNERFPSAVADHPVGEWNTFHIRMIGPNVTVKLNGQLIVDNVVMENYWDRSRPIEQLGSIFLQDHGNTLWFRNIFLREIPAEEANAHLRESSPEFKAIFNGKSLKGWMGARENYIVSEGTISCREGQGGTLYTQDKYEDFVAQLDFRLPPGGNNGLAIRYPGTGRAHIDGFSELQVLDSEHPKYANLHPTQYHGSVYSLVPAKRGYLRPTGEWNYQKVTVKGSTIKVELNGFAILDADLSKVTESKDGEVPPGVDVRSGYFGFAGHNDAVAFRNISIKRLTNADDS